MSGRKQVSSENSGRSGRVLVCWLLLSLGAVVVLDEAAIKSSQRMCNTQRAMRHPTRLQGLASETSVKLAWMASIMFD